MLIVNYWVGSGSSEGIAQFRQDSGTCAPVVGANYQWRSRARDWYNKIFVLFHGSFFHHFLSHSWLFFTSTCA
jgi:hypothetical protein